MLQTEIRVMRKLSQYTIRCSLILILSLLAGCITPHQYQNQAFVIVNAKVADESHRQPTWIGLSSTKGLMHIKSNAIIEQIRPTRYTISHFDFQKSKHSGRGTTFNDAKIRKSFKVQSGVIYFMGSITLTPSDGGVGAFSIDIQPNLKLIEQACRLRPKLFDLYPLQFVYSATPNKQYRIDCTEKELPV